MFPWCVCVCIYVCIELLIITYNYIQLYVYNIYVVIDNKMYNVEQVLSTEQGLEKYSPLATSSLMSSLEIKLYCNTATLISL